MFNKNTIIKVIECYSRLYEKQILKKTFGEDDSYLDVVRTKPNELLRFFLFSYGYQWQNAPKGLRLISMRAIYDDGVKEKIWERCQQLADNNEETGKPKVNANNNHLNPKGPKKSAFEFFGEKNNMVQKLLSASNETRIADVFFALTQVRGVAAKIASFFLRDLACHFKLKWATTDKKELKIKKEDFYFMQPIDEWVKFIATEIEMRSDPEDNEDIKKLGKKVGQGYLRYIAGICKECVENGVNPLKFNQGAWYLSSQVVGTQKYLKEILKNPEKIVEAGFVLQPFVPTEPLREALQGYGLDSLIPIKFRKSRP